MRALLLVLLGYACGCIPTGVVLGRVAGVDVRRAGSGNIGAANVARTAGAGLGLATLLGDAAKGAVPALLAHWLAGDRAAAAAGFAAFLGHLFPITLRFAGGKGVATALGVLTALCPLAVVLPALVFVLALTVWRYVSVASVLGALTALPALALLSCPAPDLAAAALMAGLIVLRHRNNFHRLRAGTEPRFSLHKRQASPAK